jgi:predicted alpha/beta-fold hydrolase
MKRDVVEPERFPKPAPDVAVRTLISNVAEKFRQSPFKPHAIFSGGHAQTLAAYAWPRRYRLQRAPVDEQRMFEIEPGVTVLADCRWQANRRQSSTIVIWHGMEGSTTSIYMIAMADKAFRAGFNVVRVNYRNCGNTEHLSPTLYHGGMSGDLRAVLHQLITKEDLKRILVVGFSLGGNMVLKLLGEYGDNPPPEVIAACVVSPSVDLRASTDMISARHNWIYHWNFVRSLKNRIRMKHQLYPELYDLERLSRIHTIRDFDEEFTSLSNGFANADDYYSRSSATRVVENIRVPTLLIHSKDDPFIPFEPMRQAAFADNPFLLLVATDQGGHVAFICADKGRDEDRFWAENRAIEFCKIAREVWSQLEPGLCEHQAARGSVKPPPSRSHF